MHSFNTILLSIYNFIWNLNPYLIYSIQKKKKKKKKKYEYLRGLCLLNPNLYIFCIFLFY